MGFWHTGYIEFHEPTGFDPPVTFKPRRFFCDRCDRSFASRDELEDHRFADHPLRSPVMIVQGRQLGANRVPITRTLRPSDVRIRCCDRARLNDGDIRVPDLPSRLADLSRSSSICCIVLTKDGVEARFELEFRIASPEDIERVESRFYEIASGERLNSRTVDDFIGPKSHFGTAIGYCDGICAYLYGVLAKERSPESHLAYGDYEGRFNRAAEILRGYDRTLARTIRSLIEFHFNHYGESVDLNPTSRVGLAAQRYWHWTRRDRTVPPHVATEDFAASGTAITDVLDELLTDETMERIIRWSLCPLSQLTRHAKDIESLLTRDLADYDTAKLHVLLGNLYAQAGNSQSASTHAKALQNIPFFETWATTLISSLPG